MRTKTTKEKKYRDKMRRKGYAQMNRWVKITDIEKIDQLIKEITNL